MSITLPPSRAGSDGPRWRWKLAGNFLRGKVPAESVDPYVAHAAALRTCLDEHGTPNLQSAVVVPDPTIEAAYRIFNENGVVRWQIEAFVLARLFDLEIARRCDIPRSVITAYVGIFFDVIDHLTACDWVMRHVIGAAPFQGFRENDVRQFWAWMAATNGPEDVTMLIDAFLAALRSGERPVLSVYFRPIVLPPIQAVAAIAVLGMAPHALMIVEKYHGAWTER